VPDGVEMVEGEGKFLMPGLSDMHVHMFGSENDLLLYLANGVTTIKDVAGGPPAQLEWRDQISSGNKVGPNIVQFSPMFEAMSTFEAIVKNWELPGGYTNASVPEKMESKVAEYTAQGYDGIKSHVVFSSDVITAIIDSSKKNIIPSDVHVPLDLTFCKDKDACWEDFRNLGVEAIAHIEELIKVTDWSDESIQLAARDVAEDDIWVTTTVALMRSIGDQIHDLDGELTKRPEIKYVNPGPRGRWMPGENPYPNIQREWLPYLKASGRTSSCWTPTRLKTSPTLGKFSA